MSGGDDMQHDLSTVVLTNVKAPNVPQIFARSTDNLQLL